jgi:Cu/Ag efflux protein CusF
MGIDMKGAAVLGAALIGLTAVPTVVLAQGVMPAISRSERETATATVKSIDKATRHLTLTSASGEDFSLKVPDEVQNFDQLKVGDTISATYVRETEIVISAPNAPLPEDTQTVVEARAAKGELPAAAVANHIEVTGAVLGIDMGRHTLRIGSPQGGEVHTVSVVRPDGRAAMAKLKVGDKITVYVTEALLVAANAR